MVQPAARRPCGEESNLPPLSYVSVRMYISDGPIFSFVYFFFVTRRPGGLTTAGGGVTQATYNDMAEVLLFLLRRTRTPRKGRGRGLPKA